MRITGGIYRSRSLKAPRGSTTRPTADRVREALFGALTASGVVQGARVLDIYAGTGALALEALSRGAASATLVESSRAAVDALRSNVALLGAGASAHVIVADAHSSLRRLTAAGPFDLVLADPPWSMVDSGQVARLLSLLARSGALAAGACIVLEHAARTFPPEPERLVRVETRRYGDSALTFYKPAILSPPPVRDIALPSAPTPSSKR